MLKYSVLIISLFLAVSADRQATSSMRRKLIGAEKCTWGPSYWCDKVKNAKECSAMNHCTDAVWKKHNEPQDPSNVCRWCDDLMDDIRAAMESNMSKPMLRGSLKDACKRVPDKSLLGNCADSLSTDLSEVMQLLAKNVPDRTICKTIGFCVADNVASTHIEPLQQVAARNTCADCYHFFEDAKELYLGNYTADEFKQMLLEQCDQAGYPAITELCKMVLEQYWPQIYARLQMFFDPRQVCYQINFCNSTNALDRKPTLLSVMPLAKLIPAARKTDLPQQLPVERMLLDIMPPMSNVKPPVKPGVKSVAMRGDTECVVCEFVMSYLDKMLEDNYTQASIQSALDRVCTYMPKTVRDQCQGFVDQYAPAILVILGNELDPAQVCAGLQLCSKDTDKGTRFCGSATCTTCTEVFQVVKTLLEDYEENVRLAKMLQQYCRNLFPVGEPMKQCEDAVITYAPYVLQMLGQLIKPDGVCHIAKMC